MMRFFHGTSSENLDSILQNGLRAPGYLTASLEDAQYYAATGGEDSLQMREEAYEERTGINAREAFEPDMWDMYEALFPQGYRPVVLAFEIAPDLFGASIPDSGAEGARMFNEVVAASNILEIIEVPWPSDAEVSPNPLGRVKP